MAKITKIAVFGLTSIILAAFLSFILQISPTQATTPNYLNGTLLKGVGDNRVWVVNNHQKVLVRSEAVFNACGFSKGRIVTTNYTWDIPLATLLKTANNPDIYVLDLAKAFKHKLRSQEIFNSYILDPSKIATICPAIMDSYAWAPLMKTKYSDNIYRTDSDYIKHLYTNMASFFADGMATKDIVEVNQLELDSYYTSEIVTPTPEPETSLTQKCSDGTLYGQCSTTSGIIPRYCDSNGNLIYRATVCGCPSGYAISGETCYSLTSTQKCSDGTLYGQCSTTKPKYCDSNNGVLIDKAGVCGCPPGYTIINQTCYEVNSPLIDSHETIVFKEQEPGELLTFSEEGWFVNHGKFIERFYQAYRDVYDFVAVFPTKKLNSHSSGSVNRDIAGIGSDYKETNLYTEKLKALLKLDFYRVWEFNPQFFDQSLLEKVLIHEIGHYWLVDIDVDKPPPGGHWLNNLDLFNGDQRYVDIMGYYQWIIKNGVETCVNGNASDSIPKFSNLSLYLMGFIPAELVSPISVHEFEEKPDDPMFNAYGPKCDQVHKFTGTKNVTIQNIITANGERRPSYTESQKDFRIAFVILAEKDENVPSDFIRYVNEYKQALPGAWNRLTDGRSNMSF